MVNLKEIKKRLEAKYVLIKEEHNSQQVKKIKSPPVKTESKHYLKK